MKSEEFKKLIKKDGYQVFLCTSPASFPLCFARHPWFVCVEDGKTSRWEIRFEHNKHKSAKGKHLYINSLPAFSGLSILPYTKTPAWSTRLLGYTEGDTSSLAKEIIDFIKQSDSTYPYCDTYSFLGTNSNTYAQWILNSFPHFKVKLPWNCFGK